MPAPSFTDADFLSGFQQLLPTGPVWPRDADSTQTQTFAALIQGYTVNAYRAVNLLTDAFPVAPVELLTEWELTLGLPDPCAGPSPTLQQSQQQVNARFIGSGGQTIDYFISVAAALGYEITITQFTPYAVGQPVGQPITGAAWTFVWQVNAPTFSIHYFEVGHDTVGEPLASWGNTVLQCELQRLAPAHTTILFNYS
jgi:uncharacterized protein YmfQ (DUF2313 family)